MNNKIFNVLKNNSNKNLKTISISIYTDFIDKEISKFTLNREVFIERPFDKNSELINGFVYIKKNYSDEKYKKEQYYFKFNIKDLEICTNFRNTQYIFKFLSNTNVKNILDYSDINNIKYQIVIISKDFTKVFKIDSFDFIFLLKRFKEHKRIIF